MLADDNNFKYFVINSCILAYTPFLILLVTSVLVNFFTLQPQEFRALYTESASLVSRRIFILIFRIMGSLHCFNADVRATMCCCTSHLDGPTATKRVVYERVLHSP